MAGWQTIFELGNTTFRALALGSTFCGSAANERRSEFARAYPARPRTPHLVFSPQEFTYVDAEHAGALAA